MDITTEFSNEAFETCKKMGINAFRDGDVNSALLLLNIKILEKLDQILSELKSPQCTNRGKNE